VNLRQKMLFRTDVRNSSMKQPPNALARNQSAKTKDELQPEDRVRKQSPKPKIEPSDSSLSRREEQPVDIDGQARVELTVKQQAVVDIALTGANMFLTGAAGCG
jgi:hypothetical protein